MLGWLFPRPPVRVHEKAWIEYRIAWLVKKLGERRLLDAQLIEPTDAFFPDEYHGQASDAEAMYRRVCGLMRVNSQDIQFEVLPADDMPSAGGHYDCTDPARKPIVRVADTKISDPEGLVATLAHEIAHHILLGGGLMTGEEEDHELTTDLLPCVLGLGIFAANSTIRTSSSSSGTWHWWSYERRGYMPSHSIGYALAIFAWLRNQRSPSWARHLRLDARESLAKGLRYLRRKGDCYITHDQLGAMRAPTLAELSQRLETGTPSLRVQALWDAAKHASGRELTGDVQRLLRHGDPSVRSAAMQAVAELSIDDEATINELDRALGDVAYEVRASAARALGVLLPGRQNVVVDLGFALEDDTSEVRIAAAMSLLHYGQQAAPAEKNILTALHQALIDCNYSMIDLLIEVIRAASGDPGQSINDYFFEHDLEFRQAAIDALYGEHAQDSQ